MFAKRKLAYRYRNNSKKPTSFLSCGSCKVQLHHKYSQIFNYVLMVFTSIQLYHKYSTNELIDIQFNYQAHRHLIQLLNSHIFNSIVALTNINSFVTLTSIQLYHTYSTVEFADIQFYHIYSTVS